MLKWLVPGVAVAVGAAALAVWGVSPHSRFAIRDSRIANASEPPTVPSVLNLAAYIPPQCYAKARDEQGTHNGCFTCHRESRIPNYVDDEDVQTTFSFARFATDNHWANSLHPPAPADIDDASLLSWVRTSNYPVNKTVGFVPDAAFRFDTDGFDHAADGRATGWRAFAYTPTPGMFWPTNGSAGDVLIRLPEAFRQNERGEEDARIYQLNFALVEAYVREQDVPIAATDERALGSDLDGDGALGTARRVAFRWPMPADAPRRYVGKAREERMAAGLFPVGTEFLHTLRYLDVQGAEVRMAPRMKEVRYMRKMRWLTYSDLQLRAQEEAREKTKTPNRLKKPMGDAEHGINNGVGWVLQGYIEDRDGKLRPQSFEETLACVGCHGGVGATTDSVFAFPRRIGWYHWTDHGLAGVAEPLRKDGQGEYAHWLAQVGGGDDYRTNEEVRARFFRADGSLDPEALHRLSKDIATLLVPSPERALALNRAYLAIVRAQSFNLGRETIVGDSPHVHTAVLQDDTTGIERAASP
ncbi:hypothetical protein LZC95_23860 [Pendulispora brunnea]|uniref:Lipoprotein n=1 Tax=Pendulispora brunnea TaxID=2905690 RepID=A0ABZ2KMF2_9BACT